MISVIIPLYNKEKYIARTLKSVLQQTYQDFEIVVVDDGSTDAGADVVKNINDSRIRLIVQQNSGVSAARNRGIQEANGEFVALLDADDEWKPEYLATQIMLVEQYPQCDVFATNYEFCDSKGNVTPTIIRKLPFRSESGELTNYFEVASCSHPPICSISIMVRKDAIQKIGGFPLGIKSGEDLLTWARLAVNYKVAYANKSLAVFNNDELAFNQDQKERKPEENDKVGEELKALFVANKNIKGLKVYVALWHKMRARIFISKNDRKNALKECFIAMKYHVAIKLLVFIVLAVMPQSVSQYAFKKLG